MRSGSEGDVVAVTQRQAPHRQQREGTPSGSCHRDHV